MDRIARLTQNPKSPAASILPMTTMNQTAELTQVPIVTSTDSIAACCRGCAGAMRGAPVPQPPPSSGTSWRSCHHHPRHSGSSGAPAHCAGCCGPAAHGHDGPPAPDLHHRPDATRLHPIKHIMMCVVISQFAMTSLIHSMLML